MKRLVAIFAIIALSAVAFAQDGQGTAAVGSAGTPVSYKPLGNASQGAIDAAVQYIKLKLGEQYYNQYISFSSGSLYEECGGNGCANKSTISFTYDIPVKEISKTAEISRSPQPWPPRISVILDDKNSVMEYRGPSRPYKFLLSAADAIAKARAYGLRNVTYAIMAVSQPVPAIVRAGGGYDVVWAVGSKDLVGECRDIGAVHECIYRGVYVDVDNGDVVGEFRINPLIMEASGGIPIPPNLPPKAQQGTENNTAVYAAVATAALILLAAIAVFARRKAR